MSQVPSPTPYWSPRQSVNARLHSPFQNLILDFFFSFDFKFSFFVRFERRFGE